MKTPTRTPSSISKTQTGSTRVVIVALVAVVLLAAGAYFLWFRGPAEIPAPSAPLPPTAKQAKPENARDIIKALRESDEVDYESAYDQAGELLKNGEVADAQLLYFFAARGGHGPSAFILANLYDPVNFDPSTSLMDEPDPFQAYKWYTSALEDGEEQAAAKLTALKAWAETAAAEGNQEAAQLLLQWKQ